MKPLFPHNLTPQKKQLLQRTLQGIHSRTLKTSDLQLSLLHFRELKIYHTLQSLIKNTADWQLANDLRDIYPSGITKDDLLATLQHLYSHPKKFKGAFVFLTSARGNFEEDLQLMRHLVSYCEEMALEIPPADLDALVDALERGFARINMSRRSFSAADRIYLQLHLLVSFHNVLFDLNCGFFKKLTGFDPPDAEAMLSVSAMDDTLGLDVAFYRLEDGKHLEQVDIRSPNNMPRFRTPLITTNLDEKAYLLESDRNIRACLFNHPLEVRRHRGHPVIVALGRKNARFRPTGFRNLTHYN